MAKVNGMAATSRNVFCRTAPRAGSAALTADLAMRAISEMQDEREASRSAIESVGPQGPDRPNSRHLTGAKPLAERNRHEAALWQSCGRMLVRHRAFVGGASNRMVQRTAVILDEQ